jgi:hypothetical protein
MSQGKIDNFYNSVTGDMGRPRPNREQRREATRKTGGFDSKKYHKV